MDREAALAVLESTTATPEQKEEALRVLGLPTTVQVDRGREITLREAARAWRRSDRTRTLARARRARVSRSHGQPRRRDRRLELGRPGRPAARRSNGERSGQDPGDDPPGESPPPLAPLEIRRDWTSWLAGRHRALSALDACSQLEFEVAA